MICAVFLVAIALLAAPASAQNYPARQILMLVPLQAGTAVDNVARVIAQKMFHVL